MQDSFTYDVTAAILVLQNKEAAAMLVYLAKIVGVEFFTYVNTSFCSNTFTWLLVSVFCRIIKLHLD